MEAILEAEVHPAGTILVGDWAGPGVPHHTGTRASDFMPGHLRAFQQATGDARWGQALDRGYALVDAMQTRHAPDTGLLPDFIVRATGDDPEPAPGGWLEGATDDDYSWNACRVPWRIAADAILTDEVRARRAVRRMTAWLREQTSGRPEHIRGGYTLDGGELGRGPEMAFLAPFGVAAMVRPSVGTHQRWLDALWEETATRPPVDYYGDSIRMLSMILMSGNGWTP